MILTRNWAIGLSRHQTERKDQLTEKGLGKLQVASGEQLKWG
jgi:hypothetical protein